MSQGFKGVENVLAIIKPLSTLEVVQELPTGDEYKQRIVQLVQTITQLKKHEFSVELELNPVTGEPDERHIYVILPSRGYVDKMYKCQPYFGCLIAQKLTHIQICPFLRYHPEMCLMCTSKKVVQNIVVFSFRTQFVSMICVKIVVQDKSMESLFATVQSKLAKPFSLREKKPLILEKIVKMTYVRSATTEEIKIAKINYVLLAV